jgi:hypothetical protein
MKKIMLAAFLFAAAGAAYAADCCVLGAACCGRPCCHMKK